MSAFSGSYLLISRNRVEIARLGGAALRPKERHTPNTCPRSTHLFILKVFFLSTARVRGGEVGRLCSSGFRARSVNFFPGGSHSCRSTFRSVLDIFSFFLTGTHTCGFDSTVRRVWNPQYKSWSVFSQDHLVKTLLGSDVGEQHNAALDALKSIRLFNYFNYLQSGQGGGEAALDAVKQKLLESPPEPSFAKKNPSWEGVCMGNRKTCTCGAPFFG